jgi:alpha-tubulin suppressor-like RCC1 family protein
MTGHGGVGAPSGKGYTKIYSTGSAFAALKADGSITAWGDSDAGGTGAPSDNGYTKIYSNVSDFAALKADGSITAWGSSDAGGTGAPSDNGYTKIYSTWSASWYSHYQRVRLCLQHLNYPTP